MSFNESRLRLRAVLAGKDCIFPASVFDPISARIAESLGYEIGMLAGSVASATIVGAPDLVVLTLPELAEQVRRITRVSTISLIIDADHGYGNALNVMRTVRELEREGAAALTVEDTRLPEAFGGPAGESLIEIDEFTGKLKAALAARQDPATIIVGRTAALRTAGREEARARIQACAAAGVDAVFLVGVKNEEEVEALSRTTRLPLLLGAIPATLDNRVFLAANNVRVALQGHIPFSVMIRALFEAYSELQKGSSPESLKPRMAPQEMIDSIVQAESYERWRRDYLGKK